MTCDVMNTCLCHRGMSNIGHLFFILIVTTNLGNIGTGLKLTNMSAPALIDFREELKLDCQFDMGGELLYAVKWYKDDHEFFRYMPHQQPHLMLFPVFGVYLELDNAHCGQSRCEVILTNLMRVKSSGSYRCELSTEAPSFRLASETHNVTVAALPKTNSRIEGLDESYYKGDILTAKCITSPSDPHQLITWYINKTQADAIYVRELKTTKPDHDGLKSSSQVLRFVVEDKYYDHNKRDVEISCMSSFAGAPTSTAKKVTQLIRLADRETKTNNQRFYWYSSSHKLNSNIYFVSLFALFSVVLKQR